MLHKLFLSKYWGLESGGGGVSLGQSVNIQPKKSVISTEASGESAAERSIHVTEYNKSH